MFILKKLITPFLLPPGLFVTILFLLAAWLWRRRRSNGAVFCLLFGIMIWAFSINPVSQWLMTGLENGVTIPARLRGDVIILLGGGIHDGVADLTGKGTPSDDMMGRIVTAARAQRQLKVPVIVSGGAFFAGSTAEAPIIGRFLIDLGVPERQVILESASRDTRENARLCKAITERNGFRHPLLVTSAYHMRRSLEAFSSAGLAVIPLPAQFRTGSKRPAIWMDLLPTAGSLHSTSKALHEYLGLLFYRFGRKESDINSKEQL